MSARSATETTSDARASSKKAFAIVAVMAVVQFTALAMLIATQRDSAHVIDASGAQRMRSQRVALLVTAAHAGRPLPDWRAELDATIDDIVRTRAELAKRSDMRTGPVGADGATPLTRRFLRYQNAARALERDPNDPVAFATIENERIPLLARLDAAVKLRTGRFEEYNRWIVGAMFLALLGQLGAIGAAWRGVMLPAIESAEAARARLAESELQFRSLFARNPDTVGIYDLDGTLRRGNRASLALLGSADVPLIGQHFSKHVADDHIERARAAFARARGGDAAEFESVFVDTTGKRIAVDVSFFPKSENGRISGVIGVAKDTRPLKTAEAEAREQSDRVAELYELSANAAADWERQIESAMHVAAQRLGFEFGLLGEVRGETFVSIAAVGPSQYEIGASRPVEKTLSRHAIVTRGVWYVGDIPNSPYAHEATGRAAAWNAVAVVPLEIDGTIYGTFALGSLVPKTEILADGDRQYLSLVASLLASGIARSQHERKLDSLAFFDRLTGLPNRTLMDHAFVDLIGTHDRSRGSLAVLYVDLDHFKDVNDTAGHAAGDTVLKLAAARMRECVRTTDTVARIGGDEFVILQLPPNGRAGANVLAERLIAELEKPFVVDGRAHTIGASIGISIFGEDGSDARTLLARADEALYRAKRGGRNRLEFATRLS